MTTRIRGTLALAVGLGATAQAQLVDTSFQPPNEDRWNYPFNLTPGVRFEASIFGAIDEPGFDDYDGQYIVGFDTSGEVPPGLDPSRYTIESARLILVIANTDGFPLDVTPDSYRTFLDPSDPDYLPDSTPGRPMEVFGTGYRNGFTAETWSATSPFGGTPTVPPAQGARNAFAALFEVDGTAVDISNRLKERFDVVPWGIGTIDGRQPGDTVAAEDVVVFEIDLCAPSAFRYLQEELARGQIRLSAASLLPASGDPTGGTGPSAFPSFYTSNNPVAQALSLTPQLDLRVRVGSPADMTGPTPGSPDGVIDADDFFFFLQLFAAGDPRADLTGSTNPNDPGFGVPDCVIDADDFFYFLARFAEG